MGVKFETKVHDVIYNNAAQGQETVFDEAGIHIDKLYEFIEINKVFVYEDFFFLITMKKQLLIVKASGDKREEIKGIFEKKENIDVVEKNKPFNIYQYLK
ncbi:hypothetical protein NSB04_19835 [Blautia pseudococcoides]|nr:hypothetical protein [Blautia pseudococcoides]